MKHTRFTTALVSVSALVAVSFLTAVPAKAAACSTYGGGNNDLACRQEANMTGPAFPTQGATNTYIGTVGNTGTTSGLAPTQTTQGPTMVTWEFPSEWTVNSVTAGSGWTCNATQTSVAPGPGSPWTVMSPANAPGYPTSFYPAVAASSTVDAVTCTYAPALAVGVTSTDVTMVVTPPVYTQSWHAVRVAYIPTVGINPTASQAMTQSSTTGWGGTVLSYDINGGTGTTPASNSALYGSANTTTAASTGFSKAGYTFGGWSCDQSIGTKAAGDSLTMPSSPSAVDVLCTAIWTANAYQLSYDAGGGTGTVPSTVPNLNVGDTPTLDAGSTLSRTGYTFAGWNCDQSIGAKAGGATVTMPASNVICTAQWTANATYQLSYNAGGGTGTVPSTVTGLNQGDTPTLDAGSTLSRTGYTFAGWNCDQSIGAKAGSATVTMPAANVICTAQWTPTSSPAPSPAPAPAADIVNLNYIGNGGTCSAPNQTAAVTAWVYANSGATCSRPGYTFQGWNNSPNGNGIAIGPNGPLQLIADTTLYAIWKPVAVPSNPSQAVPVIVPVGPSANPDLQLIPIDSTQTVIFTPSALSQASPGSRFKPGGVWIAPQGTDKWTNKIIVPGKGTWILTGDKVRFRPSKGFIGRSTIRYRIQDVNGQWAYSTLTVAAKAIPKDIVSGVV